MMSMLRNLARKYIIGQDEEDPEVEARREELLAARDRERTAYRESIARLDAANHFMARGDLVRSWEGASNMLKEKGL